MDVDRSPREGHDDRNWWISWLKVEPRFDPLRPEPRFQALLARMKYPD